MRNEDVRDDARVGDENKLDGIRDAREQSKVNQLCLPRLVPNKAACV